MRIRCFKEPLPELDALIGAHNFLFYNYPDALGALGCGASEEGARDVR